MENTFKSLEEFEKNPALFIKLLAPILLAVSFGLVFVMWLQLEADIHRQMPIVRILAVPIILFGIMAIINIMLFVKSSPITKFLAVFFIGAIFSAPEVTTAAGKFLLQGYELEHQGSINSSFYESTGKIVSDRNSTQNIGPAKKRD